MESVFATAMAGAASAHQASTASSEETSQPRADRTRRTSPDPQRAQQGATAAADAAPAALDSLSRLQRLADASPQAAQLQRLRALADGRSAPVAQLAGGPEEEELVQGKFATAELPPPLQQAPRVNNTGLPDQLKSGIESLSGLSMDHVRVHYNSSQPAQLNALAYAQGSDIHLAPGQEQHLPHEAWHVVQQAQGRVKPTLQMQEGVPVNDDVRLEAEADTMKAAAQSQSAKTQPVASSATATLSGTATFIDNRPEATARRQMKENIHNSPRVLQQKALAEQIKNSPRVVAQRHQMESLIVGPAQQQTKPEEKLLQGRFMPVQRLEKDEELQKKPTIQTRGIAVNADHDLEHEADLMGEKASRQTQFRQMAPLIVPPRATSGNSAPVQGMFINRGLEDDIAYKRVYDFLVSRGSNGATLAPGTAATITATNAAEPIDILLHGGKPTEQEESSVLFWTPAQLLEQIEASGFEASKHTGDITLLACHAGYSLDGKAPSFAAEFAEHLRKKGYAGKVYAVEGSVQPPQTGKKDPLSETAKLWQSDPADGHLKDLSTAYAARVDPVFDAQNYLEDDESEPNAGDTVTIARNYLLSVLSAIEKYRYICLKSLEGFEDFEPRLKEWSNKVVDQLEIVMATTKDQAGKPVAELPERNALNDALTALRSVLGDELDILRKEYAKARVKNSGYVQGVSDLFKPLAFQEF